RDDQKLQHGDMDQRTINMERVLPPGSTSSIERAVGVDSHLFHPGAEGLIPVADNASPAIGSPMKPALETSSP
ncbi:MAG TPA: hypothetical protein PLW57_04935, partial [Sphaerochaeta sp.]|nr:hypothetical protein [Sphaerochaeta sp.]HPK64193.1 hypothetical protein [Sphaerochaeta sp.]